MSCSLQYHTTLSEYSLDEPSDEPSKETVSSLEAVILSSVITPDGPRPFLVVRFLRRILAFGLR